MTDRAMPIQCRPADASETATCRALLPVLGGLPVEWLVAIDDRADAGAQLAGVAGVVWQNRHRDGGFTVAVEVPQPLRRRGIGRMLIEAAVALCDGETPGLWALDALAPGSPAAEFVQSCGFRARSQTFYFDVELTAVLPTLTGKAARARDAGGIAAEAGVMPLAACHVDDVAALVSTALGSPPLAVRTEAQRLIGDQANTLSVVAIVDGEVAACTLSRIVVDPVSNAKIGIVDAAVVAPAFRGAHLSQIMMKAVIDETMKRGITHGRFQSEDHVVSTFDVGGRIAAGPIRSSVRFFRPLRPDEAHPPRTP